MKKAVILVSGGADSATVLSIAHKAGYDIYPISFFYGQRNRFEIECSKKLTEQFGVSSRHKVLEIDPIIFNSALTRQFEVPKHRFVNEIPDNIPVTYVPARNTIFLSYALGFAESLGAFDIFIGAHAVDYSGYPDCRPEYFKAFEDMANLATKAGVEGNKITIHTPLINLDKAQIIEIGLSNGVDYSMTISCYDPHEDGSSCGQCDACMIRLKAFAKLAYQDPINYTTNTISQIKSGE
jgi:7-cyano-7-deazaguanine synthase